MSKIININITIINFNSYQLGQCPEGEYIGRRHRFFPRASMLANPFPIGQKGATRAEVIRRFKRELHRQILTGGPMLDELLRLARLYLKQGRLTLICFCMPLACHGEVIRDAIQWLIGTEIVRPAKQQPSQP